MKKQGGFYGFIIHLQFVLYIIYINPKETIMKNSTHPSAQKTIHPVILCGGSGTRLWPLSRASYPKQFTPLLNGQSLLSATLTRFASPKFHSPMLLCNTQTRFLVGEATQSANIQNPQIIVEPAKCNTAPSVAVAAILLAREDPDAWMLVCPSDHIIGDAERFHAGIDIALKATDNNDFITFGITPDRAETGFGYIELSAPITKTEPNPFKQFIEKPNAERATAMVESKRFLWNSGMFLLRAQFALDCFARFAPKILQAAQNATANAQTDTDFVRLSDDYAGAETISFDYAIAEKLQGVTIALDCGWNDLGNWNAVWQAEMKTSTKTNDGLVISPDTLAIDCQNSLIKSYDRNVQIVGIGLNNMIAVATGDAVLVASMDKIDALSDAVATLQKQGKPPANKQKDT